MATIKSHRRSGRIRDLSGLQVAFRSIWRWFGWIALIGSGVFLAWKVTGFESTGSLALDFKLQVAQRLVDGHTLYPADGNGEYPYPPLWAMLVSPFLLLPTTAAQYAGCALCALAIVTAVWIIGVRDPFCYAAALISNPVVTGTQIGNASAFVMLLLALTYRYSGAPAGVAVAVKLYAWPVVLWSAMQRGVRDLMLGIGVAITAIVMPWAAIGFDGINRFPSVAREVIPDHGTYAFPTTIGLIVATLSLAAMWRRRADPVGSFSFAIVAMLAATPVLWDFYFTAALLPLGLRRPRFSPAWLVPFLAVVTRDHGYAYVFLALLVWCGVGAPSAKVVVSVMRSERSAHA